MFCLVWCLFVTAHCLDISYDMVLVSRRDIHVALWIGYGYPTHLSLRTSNTVHSVCLPHLTHLIQLISSLIETARPKLGVSDKGDTKHAVLGVLRDRIKKALVPRLFLDTRSSLHPVLIL